MFSMIEYQDIIRVLLNGESGRYVPDGIAYSFPVASRDHFGNLIDNFFLYGVDFSSGISPSPFAHIGIYSDAEKIAYYRTSEDIHFPDQVQTFPPEFSFDVYEQLCQSYETDYPKIRSFAFSTLLQADQRKLLLDFFNTLQLLFKGQMCYYRHIAPAFFSWMIHMLLPDISFMDLCAEGDASLTEIRQYLEIAGNDVADQKALLGMNDAEFSAWQMQGDNILRRILHSRQMGEDFTTYANMSKDQQLAARSFDPSIIDKLKHEDT